MKEGEKENRVKDGGLLVLGMIHLHTGEMFHSYTKRETRTNKTETERDREKNGGGGRGRKERRKTE